MLGFLTGVGIVRWCCSDLRGRDGEYAEIIKNRFAAAATFWPIVWVGIVAMGFYIVVGRPIGWVISRTLDACVWVSEWRK